MRSVSCTWCDESSPLDEQCCATNATKETSQSSAHQQQQQVLLRDLECPGISYDLTFNSPTISRTKCSLGPSMLRAQLCRNWWLSVSFRPSQVGCHNVIVLLHGSLMDRKGLFRKASRPDFDIPFAGGNSYHVYWTYLHC